MGAQFINGAENPLYKIANRLGLIADVVSDTAHVDNAHFAFGSQNVKEYVFSSGLNNNEYSSMQFSQVTFTIATCLFCITFQSHVTSYYQLK